MSLRSMQSRTWGSCNLKARAEGISGPHEFALQAQQDNKNPEEGRRPSKSCKGAVSERGLHVISCDAKGPRATVRTLSRVMISSNEEA